MVKLKKYQWKNISPVLYATIVLVPWRKWEFFEDYIELEELEKAKKLVKEL